MGIQQFDPANYRVEYVPQRLASLEACVIACYTVLSAEVQKQAELNMGSIKLSLPDSKLFVDIAIDAGLVANRTLLNFLGLKLDNGQLINQSYALTIEKFSLPLVSVADACTVLEPEITSVEMRRIWLEALNTASKSTAHFTEAGATIRVARLGFACYATSKLVRQKFFSATGIVEPDSIIHSDIKPKFGGVWDVVDPNINVLC
jgi:hypothetical protein